MTGENSFKKYDREGAYHHDLMSSDQFYIAKIKKALSMVNSGSVVWDIGCGDGVFLKYAKEVGARIFGIDTSVEGIKLAKIFSDCENLCIGSANNLPLSPSSADLFVMIDVINYIQDYAGAIREAAKALKSEGNLLIMSPNNISLEEEKNTIQDSWQRHVCSVEDLRAVIEEELEVTEVSFIKRPVLITWVQYVVNILGWIGVIRLVKLIISSKKNNSNSGDEIKEFNDGYNGDIHLSYSNMPQALIKKYETIEFIIVARKRL